MLTARNASTVAQPLARYSHAIEVPADARWLYVSGQVGMRPDGEVPADIEAQADQAFANVVAILEDAGMSVADLVKVTSFLVGTEQIPAYRAAREKHLGKAAPASTLLVIDALARPDLKIEVEAVAAKA